MTAPVPMEDGCCTEDDCRRHYPIGLYLGDFSGQVYAVTKRRVVSEREDGTATFAATERHDITRQMRQFIRSNPEWVRAQLGVNWDAFWPAHEPVLIPLGAEEEEARNTAVFIGCEAAGGDRDAQLADARQLLEACGLIPYQAHSRSSSPPAGCANTIVNYTRPGA